MFQQAIAILVIIFIYSRVLAQKKRGSITASEFILWTLFWSCGLVAIIFIKKIDALAAQIGFSGKGIEVLLYLATALLFYLYIKVRLRIARMEKEITRIVRQIAVANPRMPDKSQPAGGKKTLN